MFVLMACLMGGLTINANAQVKIQKADNKKEAKTEEVKKEGKEVKKELKEVNKEANKASSKTVSMEGKKTVKMVDWNSEIKEYGLIVDKCVKLYKNLNTKDAKVNTEDFNKSVKMALAQKEKIEKSKDQLNRTQVARFKKITKKLDKILTKG